MRGVGVSVALGLVLVMGVPIARGQDGAAPPATGEPPPAPAEGAGGGGAEPGTGLREVFPHVRVDASAGLVEFDGEVPIDCHDPQTPRVYLELVACGRDSKEHESLVVTDALASHVHAALLLTGVEPGSPGSWRWSEEKRGLERVEPTGARLRVTVAYRREDGEEVEAPAESWVAHAEGTERFDDGGGWVFAGSRMVRRQGQERYDADGAGTLVGLATFGGETIAWTRVISHSAEVEEPEWIADPAVVPAVGTKVVVRVRVVR